MKIAMLLILSWAIAGAFALDAEESMRAVKRPDTAAPNTLYPGNKSPLLVSPLVKLPVGAVKPRGWVRKQLELEAEGFTGHLHELSGFLKEDGNAWLSPQGIGDKSCWEELPYWLKGYGDLGYLLGNERIVKEARRWIEAALASQQEDGYFGPRANLNRRPDGTQGAPDIWPNMVMLNVLQSYCEFSGDERVIKLMTGYFRWELSVPEKDFLPGSWQKQRASDNLASVYWLYNRTGEPWLLELAAKIHRNTDNWTKEIASWHGVNFAQCFRGPAVYFQQSQDPKHLAAAVRNYDTMRNLYGQVPGGLYGADENCRPGYADPRQAAETCTMVEMMLSHEILLAITGDPLWADRCEDVAVNSLPASMTPDLKSLRYLTSPNMVLSDRHNKAPGVQNSGPMLLFDPYSHRCCQHNVSHGWPYYVEHLWMAAPGNGLAAVIYAPCQVKAKVADGAEVCITETTNYPFDETIELAVALPKPARFPLYLRVPGWCSEPAVKINGKPMAIEASPRSYLAIERTWADGDQVSLELPMKIAIVTWTKNKNCVSIQRGPLTYSVKIGQKYVRLPKSDKDRWPAAEIHPTTPWNYGLVLDPKDPAASFEVVKRPWSVGNQPFEYDAAPIELRVKARKIPAWKMDYLGLVGLLCPSPVKSDEPEETISLVPMGCTRLRIASIPVIGSGPDASEWTEPRTTVPHAASHCFENDALSALSDGQIPQHSNDQGIPRFTWWPHCGGSEWVSYEFPKPRAVSQVEVYWFDDTGVGQCRVPKSWRVEYRQGDDWRPVAKAGVCGVERDKFNKTPFDPVTTRQLRLVVELQPGFSGGILEWRVK